MKTVPFTAFRKNASEVLDLVEKGETVRLLRHGKPVAQIIPMVGRESPPAWKRARPRLVIKGASLSRVLLQERRSSP